MDNYQIWQIEKYGNALQQDAQPIETDVDVFAEWMESKSEMQLIENIF